MVLIVAPAFPETPSSDRFFESLRNDPPGDSPPVDSSRSPLEATPSDSPALRPPPEKPPFFFPIQPSVNPERKLRLDPSGAGEPSHQLLLPSGDEKIKSPDTTPETVQDSRHDRQSQQALVRFDRDARTFPGSFYLGVRWPGISVGFREPPYTVEFKYLDDSNDVRITGLRLYHHLLRVEDNNLYWGADLARLSFEGSVSEGTGNSAGVFLGFEKRIVNRFTWSLDIGPYFIHLRDDSTNITQQGLEFTMTTGLNVALF